jgi:hypothetical protein
VRLSLFQFGRRNIVFFVFVGVALVALLFGLGLLPFPSQTTMTPSSNIIVEENAHQGTSSWKIPNGRKAFNQIQAYASATSVLPGHTLTFYVSTQKEDILYSIAIYRLGWYAGSGGRLMGSQENLVGHTQGYYDNNVHLLVGCSSCHVDSQTGLVEANWQPSYTFTVPFGWTTGIYLAKFTDSNGLQTYVPFDVRGNLYSRYVAVTADTTNAAYNEWGGYSLYSAYSSIGTGRLGRGVKVSFDRPITQAEGSGQVLYIEADAIHWLERQGYDLSYMSSVDLHEDPAQMLQHRAYLSLGHDEYWTKEMRDGVEHARDEGVGLAFMGANAAYWQMRFEPDSKGIPDQTIVCFKVETTFHDLARDPFYGKDNTRVTALWRDPVLARPENALVGVMYSSRTAQWNFPWQVNPLTKSPLFDGTGLQPGHSYGCAVVGNEWDRIFANGASPVGLEVLGVSHTMNVHNKPDFSNTTYYIASSGAMVFATGSIYWTASLDSYRFFTDKSCINQDIVVPGMQKLMAKIMDALVTHRALSPLKSMAGLFESRSFLFHVPFGGRSPLTSSWGDIRPVNRCAL